MTGRQNTSINTHAPEMVSSIEAEPRNQINTSKIIDPNSTIIEPKSKKKKHTNTVSFGVSLIGCSIVAYIIYNIIASI